MSERLSRDDASSTLLLVEVLRSEPASSKSQDARSSARGGEEKREDEVESKEPALDDEEVETIDERLLEDEREEWERAIGLEVTEGGGGGSAKSSTRAPRADLADEVKTSRLVRNGAGGGAEPTRAEGGGRGEPSLDVDAEDESSETPRKSPARLVRLPRPARRDAVPLEGAETGEASGVRDGEAAEGGPAAEEPRATRLTMVCHCDLSLASSTSLEASASRSSRDLDSF